MCLVYCLSTPTYIIMPHENHYSCLLYHVFGTSTIKSFRFQDLLRQKTAVTVHLFFGRFIIHDPERRLKVFDPNSVYLPTKKIGKNNPKATEIEADNAARQDWNRTADMALVSGIAEAKIIEIRNEHVYEEATRSVQKHGWLPGLFREIIQKAKEILQVLIRETEAPPKPTLSVDMAEYRKMQKLMVKVQDEARAVKQLMHGELPKLEKQLAETTGLFKGKERKALQEKIARVQQEIDRRMDRLPGILRGRLSRRASVQTDV